MQYPNVHLTVSVWLLHVKRIQYHFYEHAESHVNVFIDNINYQTVYFILDKWSDNSLPVYM